MKQRLALTFVKGGGLVFSGVLTVMLFLSQFGQTQTGWALALAGLAMFEGGVLAWALLHEAGKEGQRFVAATCLWLTVALSLFSSCSEIVLATDLGKAALAGIDFSFLSLLAIVAALCTNVCGAIAYAGEEPQAKRAAKKLDQDARLAAMRDKAQDAVMTRADTDINSRIDESAFELSGLVVDRALDDTTSAIEELSGKRRLAAPQNTPDPYAALTDVLARLIPNAPSPTPSAAYMASGGGSETYQAQAPAVQAQTPMADNPSEAWMDDMPAPVPMDPNAPPNQAEADMLSKTLEAMHAQQNEMATLRAKLDAILAQAPPAVGEAQAPKEKARKTTQRKRAA